MDIIQSLVQSVFSHQEVRKTRFSRELITNFPLDSITYFTTILGILISRNIAFPISTRNSPAAIAHLIEKTGVDFLLVGREEAYQSLAVSSIELLETRKPETPPMFAFDDVYNDDGEVFDIAFSVPRPAMESTAIILHSSGTSAFPKPILWSHYGLVQQSIVPCKPRLSLSCYFSSSFLYEVFGEIDLTGLRVACHAIPVFHAMGVVHACFAVLQILAYSSASNN